MHEQLLIRNNLLHFFLSQYQSSFLGGFPILELQYRTIIISHLNESDFLEKLLILKEMHSHEPRPREREQGKQSKNVTPPLRTQDLLNRTNLSLFLSNQYCLCDQDYLLDHTQSFGDSINLKGKKIISEGLCHVVQPLRHFQKYLHMIHLTATERKLMLL